MLMMASAQRISSIDQTEIRFLVEKNADGIIVVDDDGVVLFANPAAEQIFGRPVALLIGSPIGIPLLSSDTAEISIHRPGGDRIDAEIRTVETTWDRRPARLATLRDISARKAMEEKISHAAKMEAIGRLTAGIAHDFNNLLTVVLGNLESAQRRTIPDAARRALQNATKGARRAAVLTERLLSFARRKPLEPRLLDANILIAGLSDLLKRTLGESIQVETVLSHEVCCVEIDPAEMESAILNLAVNARDAMPSGGRLTITTETVGMDLSPAADSEMRPGAYVLIAVSDTGSGMTTEVLRQVFEPFFTTKSDGGGTGLGLSQVYGFVKQSGGHIKLYSEPGLGTTVRIYLPRHPETPEAGRTQQATVKDADALAPSRSGEVILVVEDNDDVRSYTVGSLRELGYVVLEAIDAAAALEIVRRNPNIHLLFTDLGLPGGVDGRALAERIRMLRPSMPVLITTAYAGSTLSRAGRLDPDIELLRKPFNLAALAARIRDVLDRTGRQEHVEVPILLVEDEALIRMVVVEMLEEAGCKPIDAVGFREAVALLDRVGAELAAAIIDLGLPDGSGEALATRIRQSRPQLPIILATGSADVALRRRWEGGSARVLQKPYDPHELTGALRELGVLAPDR